MQERRLQGIWIEVETGNQQSPDSDIENDIQQKDDDANCFEASESKRN